MRTRAGRRDPSCGRRCRLRRLLVEHCHRSADCATVGYGQAQPAAGDEISHRQGRRSVPRRGGCRDRERSVAFALQDCYCVIAAVGHGQVRDAVPVEVSHGYSRWGVARGWDRPIEESPIPSAQENRYCVVAAVCNGQIGLAVSVEIGRHHRYGIETGFGNRHPHGEVSVAIVLIRRHNVLVRCSGERGQHGNIRSTVPQKVSYPDGEYRTVPRNDRRCLKRSVPIAQKDGEDGISSNLADDHKVLVPVSIEVSSSDRGSRSARKAERNLNRFSTASIAED